jgi:hypothetical protein
MKKEILLLGYTALIDTLSILILVFLGILADENIEYENFTEAYTLGIRYNYDILPYLTLFVLITTLCFQFYLCFKLLVQVLKKAKEN